MPPWRCGHCTNVRISTDTGALAPKTAACEAELGPPDCGFGRCRHVIPLTAENFGARVINSQMPWMVHIYVWHGPEKAYKDVSIMIVCLQAFWDGHAKLLAKWWAKSAEIMRGKVCLRLRRIVIARFASSCEVLPFI